MKNNYIELLKKISTEDPPIFIFGGFAEEALLFEKTTRPHEDVDILVLRKDLENYVRKFQSFGFKDYEIYLEDPSGQPTVLHTEEGGLAVELCVFDQDDKGKVYFDIFGETDDDKWRIFLPSGAFEYQKTNVDGVEIQTVSPLAQYQIRTALGITGSFGGFREKDKKAQKALKEKYFADKSEEELKPRVQRMSE